MAANTIRLLIAGSQAGSLIGMSGQNIEKLRNSSGATISILAPNQLPLCASAYASDRVVQVSLSCLHLQIWLCCRMKGLFLTWQATCAFVLVKMLDNKVRKWYQSMKLI